MPVGCGEVHVVEGGRVDAPAAVFLHGWPEDWSAWEAVMTLAAPHAHVVALDLPGVGGSVMGDAPRRKQDIAAVVHEVIRALGLSRVTLVGHDAGGMVAYASLRHHADTLERVVILDVVIPGLDPWDDVLRNPYIWHFAFHNIPDLPETLVQGQQAAYFGYFFDQVAGRPDAIPAPARARYVQAYTRPEALSAGFGWYRAFAQDAEDNAALTSYVETPLLYLRGEKEGGDITTYEQGFRKVGLRHIHTGMIGGSGHFAPEENPQAVWSHISAFMGLAP